MWRCRKCGSSERRNGRTDCAECHRRRERARRTADPERDRARARAYGNAHRAERAARAKAWREAYPERARADVRRWLDENPERRRRVQAEWRERNRERLREYDRMRLLGRDELSAEYARILRADACSYCGLRHTVHIDHVDAVAKDGGNEWENLTAACPACNGAKQDKRLLLYLLRR